MQKTTSQRAAGKLNGKRAIMMANALVYMTDESLFISLTGRKVEFLNAFLHNLASEWCDLGRFYAVDF